jgi:NADH dehydrogenase FAD-containing subunit
VAVIGGDATSIELAMAIRHRLPGAAVTLVTGGAPVASTYPEVMQRSVVKALKARDVTVLLDRCVGLQRGEVLLGCGARLACDVPVLATDLQAPAWFGNSGLALDKEGLIAIDACQRSASHPNVFAAGSVTTTRVGAALEHSLAAATAGREPRIQPPLQPARQWLSCGDGTAIAYWHGLAVQGRWVGAWKDRVDRRFIASYDKSALRP